MKPSANLGAVDAALAPFQAADEEPRQEQEWSRSTRWVRPDDGDASPNRSLCEAIIPIALLAFQVTFFPLGHPWFVAVAMSLSGLAVIYGVYGLGWLSNSSRRWHLVPPWWFDGKNYAHGVLFIATLFVAGLGPIFSIRYFEVPLPNAVSPWRYFAWCLIQDFVFFSLILRGLVDLVHPYLAIGVTAILFGLSHYPNYHMLIGTMLLAAAWGLFVPRFAVVTVRGCIALGDGNDVAVAIGRQGKSESINFAAFHACESHGLHSDAIRIESLVPGPIALGMHFAT